MKKFVKKYIFLISVYAFFLLYLCMYLFRLSVGWNAQMSQDGVISRMFGMAAVVFFANMVTAYVVSEREKWKILAGIFLVESIIYLAALGVCLCITGNMFAAYIIRLLVAAAAFVLLPWIFAIMLGEIASRIKNDFDSALFLVISVWVFIFPRCIYRILAFDWQAQWQAVPWIAGIYKRLEIFQSYSDLYVMQNPYDPFAVTSARLEWILGLIILSTAVAALLSQSGKGLIRKSILSGTLLVLAIGLMVRALQPENEYYVMCADIMESFEMGESLDSWHQDWYYYKDMDLTGKDWTAADFSIKKYEIFIEAGRETQFQVQCEIEDNGSEELIFTLYHNYGIWHITDADGNELKYEQDRDSIAVWNTPGNSVIKFYYAGAAPVYMADKRHIEFPEYYKYYPVAGMVPVFIVPEQNYDKRLSETLADFHVKVEAPYQVYSNLQETGENEFAGRAAGVALIGGMGVETCAYDTVRIIYPKLLYSREQVLEAYEQLTEEHERLKNKNWIVTGYKAGTYAGYYCADEYFFGSYEELMYLLDYGLRSER